MAHLWFGDFCFWFAKRVGLTHRIRFVIYSRLRPFFMGHEKYKNYKIQKKVFPAERQFAWEPKYISVGHISYFSVWNQRSHHATADNFRHKALSEANSLAADALCLWYEACQLWHRLVDRGTRSDGSCQTNMIFVGHLSPTEMGPIFVFFLTRCLTDKNEVGLTRTITASAANHQSIKKLAGIMSETRRVGGKRVCLAEWPVAKFIGGRVVWPLVSSGKYEMWPTKMYSPNTKIYLVLRRHAFWWFKIFFLSANFLYKSWSHKKM